MNQPLISICIPAYKRIEFLQRLLESIAIQTFRDFEVIITDDSPTHEVEELAKKYQSTFTVHYYKNEKVLGTPENWNEAIRRANGQWIKIMHDDDWFCDEESLGEFAQLAKQNQDKFIFSAYINNFLDKQETESVKPSGFRLRLLRKNPDTLLAKNCIGPPSVVLYKAGENEIFDKNLKWLVDIEFYIRKLKNKEFAFNNKPLINVGMSKEQVTSFCHTNPSVEIPEHQYFLKKNGVISLKNIWVYDAWWRLFRNFNIRQPKDLEKYTDGDWPPIINQIMKHLRCWPQWLLRIGVFSKFLMSLSFLKVKKKIK